jgi:hypothetical protein
LPPLIGNPWAPPALAACRLLCGKAALPRLSLFNFQRGAEPRANVENTNGKPEAYRTEGGEPHALRVPRPRVTLSQFANQQTLDSYFRINLLKFVSLHSRLPLPLLG